MTLLDLSLADLVRNHGTEAARRAHLAAADAVEQIGAFIEQHGIDCDWRHGGLMVVATNATQEVKVQRDLEAAEAIGVDDHVPLTGAEARERVSSPLYRCGTTRRMLPSSTRSSWPSRWSWRPSGAA
jgi:hypothetical protein